MKEKLVALVLLVVLVIGIFIYGVSNRYQMKPSHVEINGVYLLDVWTGNLYFCRKANAKERLVWGGRFCESVSRSR